MYAMGEVPIAIVLYHFDEDPINVECPAGVYYAPSELPYTGGVSSVRWAMPIATNSSQK